MSMYVFVHSAEPRWFLSQVVVATLGLKPDTTIFPCNRWVLSGSAIHEIK